MRFRFRFVGALIAVVALVFTGLPAQAAEVAPTRITGVLTDVDGDVVRNVTVRFENVDTGRVSDTSPDVDGRFGSTLPAGDYRVSAFSHHDPAREAYNARWYPGVGTAGEAQIVSLTEGRTIDTSWQLGAVGPGVTGIVTDALTGQPVVGASVSLDGPVRPWETTNRDGRYRFSLLPPGEYDVRVDSPSDGDYVVATASLTVSQGFTTWSVSVEPTGMLSVATGRYSSVRADLIPVGGVREIHAPTGSNVINAEDLPPGDYHLRIRPERGMHNFVETWWPAGETRADAGVITIRSRQTTEITADLVRGGVVEGRVVSAGTSAPVAGAYVTAYTSAGVEAGWAQADKEGRYRIVALRSGEYRITSSGNGHSQLSTTARVQLGETTPLDIGLSPRGALSVTVSSTQMIVGRTVSLYDGDLKLVAKRQLSERGQSETVAFDDLDAGEYFLGADGSSDILGGWYDGASTSAGARTVTVVPGEVSKVDYRLSVATAANSGSISVAAVGPRGEPVTGSAVWLYDADGVVRGRDLLQVDPVTFPALPPGDYRLRFADSTSEHRYRYTTTWWGGSDLADATLIHVDAGKTTAVRPTLARTLPSESATIVGTLSSKLPELFEGARVIAWAETRNSVARAGTGIVDAKGRFQIVGLLPGRYHLQMDDHPRWTDGVAPVWLASEGDWRTSRVFTLAEGQTVRVDEKMPDETDQLNHATLRGIVREGGTPVPGAVVTVRGRTETVTVRTDSYGRFEAWLEGGHTTTVEIAARTTTVKYSTQVTGMNRRIATLDVALTRVLATPAPTLSAAPAVGRSVTARTTGWTSGTTVTYQWRRNGKPIASATKSSYTPVAADRGAKLTVTVTGKKAGYATASRTSAAKAVGYGTLTSSTPRITGATARGKTLTVQPGAWTRGTSLTYQWYADGVRIKGATRSSLTLTSGLVGDKISVKVTGSKSGYATHSRSSAATARVRR
ncbi:carboxypeptidase regulatory-like domain-containing protein [Microbacterium sp. 1P06AB]|uniref:carboxypeptidase regulatory-like domain-containing protein n=1 Tax=Microbacterium sp. 1P06AB TaxID=3132289 RepID=UPI0039A5ABD1